jgi:hypothetical protein
MTERAKVRIDQASLTFGELAEVEEVLGASLSDLFTRSQARGMAALVWITVRRTDPEFTFDAALQYGPNDIDTGDPDPVAPSVSDGATPLNSPALGASALATS